jgi:hypothetical protein
MSPEQSWVPSPPEAGCTASAGARPVSTEQEIRREAAACLSVTGLGLLLVAPLERRLGSGPSRSIA